MSFKGQKAIITGGGKNLGALIATSLAKQGADAVVIHYNSPAAKAETEATLKTIQGLGVKAAAFQGDLTSASAMTSFFQEASKFIGGGKFDIAVNTIGKVLKKPVADITEAEYDSMFATNAKAGFFFIQQAEKYLNDGGTIISVVTALLGAFAPGYSTYQGSKSPVEWFTKAASKEYMGRGIRVNAVAPGPMDTPFFYGQESDDAVAFHKSQGLGGRLTKIEDIAPLILFLAQDKWITGQLLFSNGGYTTR